MRTLLIAALLVGVAGAQTHCQCNSDKPPVNSLLSEAYTTVPPPTDCRNGFHLACYDDTPKLVAGAQESKPICSVPMEGNGVLFSDGHVSTYPMGTPESFGALFPCQKEDYAKAHAPEVEPKPEAMDHKIGGQDAGIGDSGLSADEIGPEGDGPPIWGILTTKSPKPEAMDVKPVMVTEILAGWEELDGVPWWPSFDEKCPHGRWKHDKRGNGLFDCTHPVCKDKRRALIQSEDGKLHCILFPTQEAK